MEIKQRSKFGSDMRVKSLKFGRHFLEAQTQSFKVKAHSLFNLILITGKVTICLHFTNEGFEAPKDGLTWQGQVSFLRRRAGTLSPEFSIPSRASKGLSPSSRMDYRYREHTAQEACLNSYWLTIHSPWDGYKMLNQVATIRCSHVLERNPTEKLVK